ncbi:hypothetical protein [Lysobacter gummosus]|uniref:hypothetical protein n=1 Tax=Lysobacter gummosus TaxID=262324 RepID=UPI003625110C
MIRIDKDSLFMRSSLLPSHPPTTARCRVARAESSRIAQEPDRAKAAPPPRPAHPNMA